MEKARDASGSVDRDFDRNKLHPLPALGDGICLCAPLGILVSRDNKFKTDLGERVYGGIYFEFDWVSLDCRNRRRIWPIAQAGQHFGSHCVLQHIWTSPSAYGMDLEVVLSKPKIKLERSKFRGPRVAFVFDRDVLPANIPLEPRIRLDEIAV